MKRTFKCLLIIISLVITRVEAQEIVELRKSKSNKVILKYMFNAGSMMDPKGKEGLTALTVRLISDGGSTPYSKSEIDDLLYPMSAGYNATVDKEVSVFTFEVHIDFIEKFYEIVSGLIYSPAFDEKDFERIKSNQLNFVKQRIKSSSDERYSKIALEDLLFRNTSYQHMLPGTVSGLGNITLIDVKDHYNKLFTRDNLMIGLAGKYSSDFAKKVLADTKKLPTLKSKLPEAPEVNGLDGIEVEIIEKVNALGSAIYVGFPLAVTRADDEFAALMVANSWLGEHRKSYGQLTQKIRGKRSMNYGDFTYIEWYKDGRIYLLPQPHVPRNANYFSLWIRPVQIGEQLRTQYPELADIEIGHAHFALRMALREIDMLAQNGMSREDFELTRQFLKSYTKLYTLTLEKELGYLMDSRFYGRNDYIRELDKLLEELTLEDVNKATKKYFQIDDMYVCIVTDDSEAATLAESLLKNNTSPMSYSNSVKEGLSQDILNEDKEVSDFMLNIKSVTIIKSEETFH